MRGIRTHDRARNSLKSYPLDNMNLFVEIHGVFLSLSLKN